MKAGVYYGVEDFRVAEFPEPELKENGVKIAVKYCGVCGRGRTGKYRNGSSGWCQH